MQNILALAALIVVHSYIVSAAFASQSLQLTSLKAQGSLTLPVIAPLSSSSTMQSQTVRLEFRIHSFTLPPDRPHRTVLFDLPGFDVQIWENGEICSSNHADDMPDYGNRSCAPTTGHNDVTVRDTRDTTAKTFLAQTFDTLSGVLIGGYCGSAYTGLAQRACPISTLHGIVWTGTWNFFGWIPGVSSAQSASLAWFKLNLTAPPQYGVSVGEAAAADLADFRFEGNLSSQAADPFGFILDYPTPTYAKTPSAPPICSAGVQQIFRAGADSLILDATGSYSLGGAGALTYIWQRTSGPGSVQWDSHIVAQPRVTGLIFGTHTFQLSVLDSSGQTSTCSVDDGAVATDNNAVVLTENAQMDHLLSPAVMWGKNLWPWYDQITDRTGKVFAAKQATDFQPVWRTPSTHGTVSFPITHTYSGTMVTGNGTLFSTDFFNGSCANSWDGIHVMIVWYTTQWGTLGYRTLTPTYCTDDTHMVIGQSTYFAITPVSGNQYSIMTQSQLATWINGSNNVNYYDNVLAFYSLWRTTGLEFWHNAATGLADVWWESPNIDQGQGCWDGGYSGLGYEGAWCGPSRVWALLGLMLRAADGRPDMWSHGLFLWLDNILSNNDPAAVVVDTREDSAKMGQVCTAAMFAYELGLDPTRVSRYKAFCAAMVNTHFAPRVRPNGEFLNPAYGNSSYNKGYSSITVTAGSPVVTSSAFDFTCNTHATGTQDGASRMWILQDNSLAGMYTGDTMSYAIDSCTPSAIRLHLPYAGTYAGTGRGYTLNAIGGAITQPFIMGYMAGQFALAAESLTVLGDASTAAAAKSLVTGLSKWILNPVYGGYRPATGGLFYIRNGLSGDGMLGGPDGAGGCEPDPEIANNNGGACTGSNDVQNSRFLGAETIRGIAHAYLYSPSTSLRSAADDFYGKMWGGLGGPGADSNYLSVFYPAQSGKSKDFGFCCGLGGDWQWSAARVGGAAPPAPRTILIPVRLANIPNATQVMLTVTAPSGKSTTTTCSVSPCSITVDPRQGKHILKLDYLDPSATVLAAGEPLPLYVMP